MPPTADQVRAAAESYVELFGTDRDRWLKLFADDATVTDPVPSDPHQGREALTEFWNGIMAMADNVAVDQKALHLCGDQAALVYTLALTGADGAGLAFDGVEIFTVNDEGLIASALAYWDPAELRNLAAGERP